MANKDFFSLSGERILVTGAAGGIGSAAAKACATLGAELVLADVAPAEQLRAELEAMGATASCYVANTADRAEIEELVAKSQPLDAAVDCAGLYPLGDWLTDPDWDAAFRKVLEVNLMGPVNLARAVMPAMMERRKGRIVLVGSVAGRSGGAAAGTQAHYVAAKGGVHSLVRWLSRRAIGHNVLVNGIAPGPVDTRMNAGAGHNLEALPMRRMGHPDEIGWPIAFLCTPASSYMSGAILDVNGGTFVG
ncbi:MAG TPA: SDR family oxidoreductase [Thermomicrobiales bacterium]|nr:SDR family oxidoreductase [Thermomicrobiales bacterium]